MTPPILPSDKNQEGDLDASHAASFFIALIFVLILGGGFLGWLLMDLGIGEESRLFLALGTIGQALLSLGTVIIFLRSKKMDLRRALRLTPCSWAHYLWGGIGVIAIGLIASQLGAVIIDLIPELQSENLAWLAELSAYSGDASEYLIFALALIIGPAIGEELAFRGVILRGLESSGAATAMVVSALVFALVHIDLIHILMVFPAGLFLGYLTLKSGSIYPAIVGHAINNLWSLIEPNLWNFFRPGMTSEEIAFSTAYPPEVLLLSAALLILALYNLAGKPKFLEK